MLNISLSGKEKAFFLNAARREFLKSGVDVSAEELELVFERSMEQLREERKRIEREANKHDSRLTSKEALREIESETRIVVFFDNVAPNSPPYDALGWGYSQESLDAMVDDGENEISVDLLLEDKERMKWAKKLIESDAWSAIALRSRPNPADGKYCIVIERKRT